MNTETDQINDEKPFETNEINEKPPLINEDTGLETDNISPKKPRESRVFNHGTGYVTFVQALKLITASRSTLARYANTGQVSFETDEKGNKLFQVIELERVFGKLKSFETDETNSVEGQKDHLTPQEIAADTTLKLALLEAENRFLKEKLEAEADKAKREAQNAEDWKNQCERMTLVLTHRPEPALTLEPELQTAPEPKKGFFGRLFGGDKP
jgi:hypothetical protein